MKNLDLFIKTNVLLNKLIACLVFFCLVMTSTSLVNNFSQQCMVVDETIQASADTILCIIFTKLGLFFNLFVISVIASDFLIFK